MRIVIALSLIAAAIPAAASAKETVRDLQARGCVVHQVHVPAGKLHIAPPVVRCPDDARQVAAKRDDTVKGSAPSPAAR